MVYHGGRVKRKPVLEPLPTIASQLATQNRMMRRQSTTQKKRKLETASQITTEEEEQDVSVHRTQRQLAAEKRKKRLIIMQDGRRPINSPGTPQYQTESRCDAFEYEIPPDSSTDGSSSEDETIDIAQDEHIINLKLKKSDLGGPTHICQYCSASVWPQERSKKSQKANAYEYSICCSKGNVKLPSRPRCPVYLAKLLDYNGGPRSMKFRRNIRAYNSMFAFTSTGAKFQDKINKKGGPWSYVIQGQNHHLIGSLLPGETKNPGFSQLYIYDTDMAEEAQRRKDIFFNAPKTVEKEKGDGKTKKKVLSIKKKVEIAGRKKTKKNVPSKRNQEKMTNIKMTKVLDTPSKKEKDELDVEIIEGLIKMMNVHNVYAKKFRMAREKMKKKPAEEVRMRIISHRNRDMRQYGLPTCSEIAALIVETPTDEKVHRDIIVEHRKKGFQRINEIHPCYTPMQFPLLFPYGEDGFGKGIPYRDVKLNEDGKILKRQEVTMREYYAYQIQHRLGEGQTVLCGGRLFQQYCVDAYACIEECRMKWVRNNQEKIRADLHKGLLDTLLKGDSSIKKGKRIVLPSSHTGGPRYMMQHYQDAIAICRSIGVPDLFITFTCNPKWKEITEALEQFPGQRAEDRPDIIARVFRMKLKHLMEVLRTKEHFGKVKGAIYTIEFQKRGLPHAHILLFLEKGYKPETPSEINRIISAELPDKTKDPEGYSAVVSHMLHGPCGNLGKSSPCMRDGDCTKNYPKEFSKETVVDKYGYPVYRRRKNKRVANKNGRDLDNTWVVPYNRDLIVMFDAHINVEVCNSRGALIKYLFKYIHKGKDMATVILEKSSDNVDDSKQQERIVDEINNYLECRYLSGAESCWRIFDFDIQFRDPSVERLPYHLEGEQQIIFNDDDDIEEVLQRPGIQKTKFLMWFEANRTSRKARNFTYADFPTGFVWDKKTKEWRERKKGNTVGRLYNAHPTSGERYFLRILLNVVKGARSYRELRTVGTTTYATYRETCVALGLLSSDNEWHEAIVEQYTYSTGNMQRELFVMLLLFSEVTDPKRLWEENWMWLCEDIQHRERKIRKDVNLELSEDEIKNMTLIDIEELMKRNGRSLAEFPTIPYPKAMKRSRRRNKLMEEELDYDKDKLMRQHKKLEQGMNSAQREIFETVNESIRKKQGGLYFVYGSGGTGKTYLWRTIITGLRAQGKIVLAVASSGIASLLLPGGRTAHSRFKIPISLDETSTCDVSQGTMLAELICKADIIIWDEAPMIHKHAFEALERTVRDLMNKTKDKRKEKLFGGKTLLMGGDFRQILPVIRGGSREDIVRASISKSYLWKHVRLFQLTENMRLANENTSPAEKKTISEFSKWILDLGNGKLPAKAIRGEDDEATWIQIPEDLLMTCEDDQDPIEAIADAIYPDLIDNYNNKKYLRERCILSPKNEEVDKINDIMVAKIPRKERVYYSSDSISPLSMDFANAEMTYNQEYLNSQKLSGVPNHILRLKVGLPVMLTRNLNPSAGLCNGTRLIVTLLKKRSIQATVVTGTGAGRKVSIPRIVIQPTESHLPFILRRVQLPIKVCFAMTINKSQGQSIDNVGIYLPKPTFTHGQLYVAVSRTTSRKGLKILLEKTKDAVPEDYTQNIVYKEIFSNLKPCNKEIETVAEDKTEQRPDDGTSDNDDDPSDDEEGSWVQAEGAEEDHAHNWQDLMPHGLEDFGNTEIGDDVGPWTELEADEQSMKDEDDNVNMYENSLSCAGLDDAEENEHNNADSDTDMLSLMDED